MRLTRRLGALTQGLAWLVAAILLTAACKKEEPAEVPSDPWVILRSDPELHIVAYLRGDLDTFGDIRIASREICAELDKDWCSIWYWSDYERAQAAARVPRYTEEMMDRRLAIFDRSDTSESVHILCPEETVVIVADTPYCRSEYKYWPRAPSEDT